MKCTCPPNSGDGIERNDRPHNILHLNPRWHPDPEEATRRTGYTLALLLFHEAKECEEELVLCRLLGATHVNLNPADRFAHT